MTSGARSILRIAMALAVALGFSAGALAQTQRAHSAAPAMTEELMGRLLKLAHGLEETRTMGASLCKALDLCDGTKDIPVKLLVSDVAGHYFGVRPDDLDGKNIVIGVLLDKNVEVYLTDKTGKLRIAAFNDKEGMRLMPNEKAAAKFQAELALFAKEAADQLPPTK